MVYPKDKPYMPKRYMSYLLNPYLLVEKKHSPVNFMEFQLGVGCASLQFLLLKSTGVIESLVCLVLSITVIDHYICLYGDCYAIGYGWF